MVAGVVVRAVAASRKGAAHARRRYKAWRRRFTRLFPAAFLALASLAILGGVVHAPNNYDAMAYRTPRVLHWLAEGRWNWIHTDFERLNTRGCGFEWVTAPLLAFTRTDRFIFVINAICFALLPGRVFSLLTRLGVRGRVAWQWMWLLPSGYCYLLQAGSIANDMFGALIAMLAIEFALRARESGRVAEAWLSGLAAALMTASKAFNLLLLLPWAVAFFPALRLLLRRPVASALVVVLSVVVSMLPTALLNYRHCGDWTGLKAEHVTNLASGDRAFHFVANAFLLSLHNLTPPIFPLAGAWNSWVVHAMPPELAARLARNFEPASSKLQVDEMQLEESAGLGFGLSILLLAVVFRMVAKRGKGQRAKGEGQRTEAAEQCASPPPLALGPRPSLIVPLGMWLALAVFMTQCGFSGPARYLAPFYVVLLAPLLAARSVGLLGGGWRWAGLGVLLLAGLLVIVSPARPLWPAATLLRSLGADQSSNPLVRRAWTVYSVYGQRADAFQPARAVLPPEANPLGMVTGDDPEAAMWRPFFTRRILHVCYGDTANDLRRQQIRYVLVSTAILAQQGLTADQWLAKYDAQVVQRMRLELRASKGPTDWFLAKLR